MNNEVNKIIKIINNSSDKTKASWWNNYLKNSIVFIGVGIPNIRTIIKNWNESQQLNHELLLEIADTLLQLEIAEYKLAGILLYQEFLLGNINNDTILNRIEKLFDKEYIFDWNTCDWFCVRILSPILDQGNSSEIQKILSWHSSSYYWKARASIVSFAESKSLKKYYKLLLKPMAVLIQREERFSKTAVGWALRNISKFDLEYVLSFLKSNAAYLSKEVIMNSLKYCDKNIKMEIVNLNRIELKNNS